MSSFTDALLAEIDNARTEKNLSAQHKQLLDIGEELLGGWSAYLFGEYKRINEPIRSVEIGLFNASTRGISLGQRWGFVRDIANSMPNSSFSKVFEKSVKHESAGELVFWFKRLKSICIENPDANERVTSNFKVIIEERCRGQQATPVTKQTFFDEAFVAIRNIYAHPQQKLKKTDELITWPLGTEYFGLINPFLSAALEEVILDVKSVVDGFHEAEVLVPLNDLNEDVVVDVAGKKVSVALAQFPDAESEEYLRITFNDAFEPYVRLYLRKPPTVSPIMRETLVREETKRQSRAVLQGLIETLFSTNSLISEPAYLNLRLVADAGGYSEDELERLIEKHLISLGREAEYQVARHHEDTRGRWNPWWSLYFAYRKALQAKLPNDRTALTEITQGFADNHSSIEYYHKRIWDELSAYVSEIGSETLDTEETKWVFDYNKWQMGRLTGYFWSRIYPEISPLGSGLGVWVVLSANRENSVDSAETGLTVGLGHYRDLMLSLLQFDDLQVDIYKYLYKRIRHYMPLMVEDFEGISCSVCDLSGLGAEYRHDIEEPYLADKVVLTGDKAISYRVSDYMELFPEPVEHHFIFELGVNIENEDPIHVDEVVQKAMLLFKQIIEDVTNFAIERGFSIEKAQSQQKRYLGRRDGLLQKLTQRTLEPDYNSMRVSEQFEAARCYAHELHIALDDFNQWSRDRFTPIRNGIHQEDLPALLLLAPSVQFAIDEQPCGLVWKFDAGKRIKQATSDRMFSAYASTGNYTVFCGIGLDEWGEWRTSVSVQGRRDDDEFREATARWVRNEAGWFIASFPERTRSVSLNFVKTQFGICKEGPVIDDLQSLAEHSELLNQALISLLSGLEQFLQSDDCLTQEKQIVTRKRGLSSQTGEMGADEDLNTAIAEDAVVFPLYEIAELKEPPSTTFLHLSDLELDEQIKLIVNIEGPVHRELLLFRVGDFNNIGRLGSRIQERLFQRLEVLLARNDLLENGAFVYCVDQEHRPRDRTDRPYRECNPSLLAAEELELALEQMKLPEVNKYVWQALGCPNGKRIREAMT